MWEERAQGRGENGMLEVDVCRGTRTGGGSWRSSRIGWRERVRVVRVRTSGTLEEGWKRESVCVKEREREMGSSKARKEAFQSGETRRVEERMLACCLLLFGLCCGCGSASGSDVLACVPESGVARASPQNCLDYDG